MRKLLAYAFVLTFVLMIAVSLVSAASVSRNMASRIAPGEDLTVTFDVSGAEVGKIFTLEDTVPEGWAFKSWEVTGSKEEKSAINHRFTENKRHGWSFTASSSNLQIKYVLGVPSNAQLKSHDFNAVWFDASGFNKNDASVTVRIVTCGDNVCEQNENSDNCEADCPKPAPPAPSAPTAPVEAPEAEAKPAAPSMTGIIIVLAIVLVGVVLFFLFFRKKKSFG